MALQITLIIVVSRTTTMHTTPNLYLIPWRTIHSIYEATRLHPKLHTPIALWTGVDCPNHCIGVAYPTSRQETARKQVVRMADAIPRPGRQCIFECLQQSDLVG